MSKKFKRALEAANEEVNQAFSVIERKQEVLETNAAIMLKDTQRMNRVIDRAPAIIHDINTQFEAATKLRGKDIAFLFSAAAIQTARWILLPGLDLDFSKTPSEQRMSASEGGQLEKKDIAAYLKKEGHSEQDIRQLMTNGHITRYTWEKLLVAPVPYDAMHGSARIVIPGLSEKGTELYSKNHHTATWGHDPVFGWIFGPLNITARMITFRTFETYHVQQVGNSFEQFITYKTTTGKMIHKAINSWSEDNKRLFVSVAKQGMHLKSDKYTKTGLPIPFLDTATTQKLLMNGWNSNEVEKVFTKAAENIGVIGAQYILAMMIDYLVRALHLLCYDPSVDGQIAAYSVKTQKVICYSNSLAEVANGIYVAFTGDVKKLDIGGYINLARNLIHNAELQRQVKAKFLEQELEKKLYGEEYDFLEA